MILADGAAYTTISEDIDGIPSEVCISFDAETGETRWKANLDLWRVDNGGGNAGAPNNKGGDGPRTTPSYSDGKIYAYTSDMLLICLSAKDGSEIWSVEVAKAHKGRNIRWENASAPLIEKDMVIIQGGGPGESFLAFDKVSGKIKWKSGDYLMTHATPVATTINDQRQVLFFTQKGIVSVNSANGKRLWMHNFPYKVSTAASAVVEKDIVYFAAGYGVGSTAIKVSKNNLFSFPYFNDDTQEIARVQLIELYPQISEELAEDMADEEIMEIDGNQSIGDLKQIINDKYSWIKNIDFNNKDSNYLFWYVSAAKLEPRLGERYNEQGSELEQNLGIAKMVSDLFKQIKNVDENKLICEFLLMHPEYRGIIKRIQSLKNYPFSEVQDNVLDKKTMPIDMLRFKLSFFGANRYDPKSDRWLRVSFFSGAPYLSDLNNKNVDEWGFATMSTY